MTFGEVTCETPNYSQRDTKRLGKSQTIPCTL